MSTTNISSSRVGFVRWLVWTPTLLYTALAVVVCIIHTENMQPVIAKLATVESQFQATREGLQRGEELSRVAQIEMARQGAHHTHHSGDFVGWTKRAFWWLTLPGIIVAGAQGWVCRKWA